MTDSGNRKLTNCFSFSTGALQIKVIAVVRFRAGQVRRGTKCSIAGWGGGEAGDFKCLTLVKLKPRPFKKPGLFFRNQARARCSPSGGSLATALRYLYLEDFRDSGLVVLHYLDVVPLAGSSHLTQSECLLGQLQMVCCKRHQTFGHVRFSTRLGEPYAPFG